MKAIQHFVFLAAVVLCGCTTRNLSVGIENARTSGGYINSTLTTIGTLFVVDTQAGSIWREDEIDVSRFERGTQVSGDRRTERATAGLSVSFDGPVSEAIKAEAGATVARETKVELKDFSTERLRSSYAVLNSSMARGVRQRLGHQYADNDRFRFVFVYGVTAANHATFSVGTGSNDSTNRLYVSIGGEKYEVKFQGERSSEWEGKRTPVLFSADVFRLQRSGSSSFEFVRDTNSQLTLTSLLNKA
jgi:hypothetical protein